MIADAARLARSLYLVRQLRETDQRLVLALTMGDIAERHGLRVDTEALAAGDRRAGRAGGPAASR